jgi:multicomponent Na+:H+ antiporter subunit C
MLNTALIFAATGAMLCALGMAGMILLAHGLRRILAFNLMSSGIYLVLVGLAQRDGSPDPVTQAMVLTGIVVGVAATALALALLRRQHELNGGGQPDAPGHGQ